MSTNDDERQARIDAIRARVSNRLRPCTVDLTDARWLLAELEAATARAERAEGALLRVAQLLDEWGGAALAPARRWGVIEARKVAAAALAEGA